MSNQFSETLLEAMQTLVKSGINSVAFDKTEVCTVISRVENEQNVYWVSNGQIKFQAVAEKDKDYSNNTSVYVTIPQGNYDLEKIIIGQYSTDKEDNKLFTNPFDNIVKAHSFSMHYDSIAKKDVEIVNINLSLTDTSEYQKPYSFYTNGFGIPQYLALRFNAKTILNDIRATGHFQINIDLQDENGKSLIITEDLTDNEIAYRKTLLTFDSSQITGNPYNLSPNLWHEHLFPFPLMKGREVIFGDLTQVKKIVYTLIPPQGEIYKTLEIPSLEFFAAYKKSDLEQNQAVLDSNINSYMTADTKAIMRINWRDISDNVLKNEKLPYKGEVNDYKIYWFKYVEGYTKTEENNDIEDSGVFWKTIQEPKSATDSTAYKYEPILDITKKQEQFKAAIVGKDYYVETNGLTFTNILYQESGKLSDVEIDNLILFLEDGDDGVYNDYGTDGKVLNTNDANQKHSISVKFADNTRWYQKKTTKITWKIPKRSSMLYLPYLMDDEGNYSYGGKLWDKNSDEHYYIYNQEIQLSDYKNDGAGQDIKFPSIEFGVRDQFDYARTNNTIYCITTLSNGDKYQGRLKLDFGMRSSSGTEYSFNIRPLNNVRSLASVNKEKPTSTMTLQAYLEKSDGTEINADLWVDNIAWSWYTCTNTTINEKPESTYILTPVTEHNNQARITRDLNRGTSTDVYAIVKAQVQMTVSNGNKIRLEAYYPIPTGGPDFYLQGATRIIYNSNGQIPVYDTETPYKLLLNNIEYKEGLTYSVVTDETTNDKSFKVDPDTGVLNVTDMLITQIPKAYLRVADGDTTIYIHPLLILRNQYQSQLLNQWDGKLAVNGETNQIFAATMVAGTKNSSNQFSGVVLGSVGREIGAAKTGLYGYKDGVKRYELTEDGTFYVGKGDDNKIDFTNGNLSIAVKNFKLESANFSYNTSDNDNKGGGTIAGWTIDDKSIRSGSLGYSGSMWLCRTGTTTSAKIGGSETINGWCIGISDNFGVTKNGYIYARAGQIAAWTLGDYYLYGYNKDGFGSGFMMKAGGSAPAFYIGYTKKVGNTDIESAKNFPANTTGWVDENNNILGDTSKDAQYGPKDGSWFSYGSVKGQISNNGYVAFGNAKKNKYFVFDGNNLTVKGRIEADEGIIGPWELTSNYLRSADNKVGMSANVDDWAFWAGYNGSTAAFQVKSDGTLKATKGEISGSLITSGINAENITAGYLSVDRIRSGSITATEIADDAIVASKIKDGSITGTLIKDGTITTSKVDANFITTSNLSAQTINADKISGKLSTNVTVAGWNIGTNSLTKGATETVKNKTVLKDGAIHLYTSFTGSSITVSEHTGSDWRLIIGKKFGVDKFGNIYCNGGTLADGLYLGSTQKIKIGTYGQMGMKIYSTGSNLWSSPYIAFGLDSNYTSVRISAIGESESRSQSCDINLIANTIKHNGTNWHTSSGSVTSDRNKKHEINILSEKYSLFFDNLRPVTYKYNDGTSNRLHTGFIAQEVQEALNVALIDSQEFAGLVSFYRNTDSETWALRYEEFIPLNTWQIQKLKTRVTELEKEIKELKQNYEIQ